MRSYDWSQSPLGPPEDWAQGLKTAVRIMLTSRQAIWIGWSRDLYILYNDACRSILGEKHPRVFGLPYRQVWPEVWDELSPMLSTAMTGDEGTYVEAQLLIMERSGYPEETYYTFSYSPIPEDASDGGRAGGVICANSEDTQRVLAERRVALLREVAMGAAQARSSQEACERSARAMSADQRDIVFGALYLRGAEGEGFSLAATCGIERGAPAAPAAVNEESPVWPLEEALRGGRPLVVSDLEARFGAGLPTGPWRRPPDSAALVPIPATGELGPPGILVVGLNPHRLFDDSYEGFLTLLAQQISGSIGSGLAYEAERRRAEELAELDRAKTAFFSNVSHEFRTPLTLMLGPVEELLSRPAESLPAEAREHLALAHRNGLRLQKLVNTLLDFSRIEAGRVQANYEPTDLASFTSELASNFRSACERAKLRLTVRAEPLSEPVFVDRDMWEKIALNLISNAFKFTLDGEIEVAVREVAGRAELMVRDTGVGIAENEKPRLFERFHRIEGAAGRTQEGSGIGLALVQELARLHGGEVRAESKLGEGSAFFVSLPFGKQHLPADRIQATRTLMPTALGAASFVEEALRWIPGPEPDGFKEAPPALLSAEISVPNRAAGDGLRARVLVVDDNADMRDYARRLLCQNFEVAAAADGRAALGLIERDAPDLVLSDVMMPELDGFGLLQELRANERTRDLPVILVSARAGEEARVEGLQAGADDYLTKPFSARELLARVDAHIRLSRLRREADRALRRSEQRFRSLFESIDTGFCIVQMLFDEERRPVDYRFLEANPAFVRQTRLEGAEGRTALEMVPNLEPFWVETYGGVAQTGKSARFQHDAPSMGRSFDVYAFPVEAARRGQVGILFNDVTEQKAAEAAIRESEARFRHMADNAPVMIWMTDATGYCTYLNQQWYQFTGTDEQQGLGLGWTNSLHPDDRGLVKEKFLEANEKQAPFSMEYRVRRRDGEYCWAIDSASPRSSEDGVFLGHIGSVTDVTELKRVENRLREADRRKDEFLATLAHELRNPLAPIRTGLEIMKRSGHTPTQLESVRRTMEQQTEQLITLVNDLLEVSRITRGKLELRKRRATLEDIAQRGIEGARPSIDEAGHELVVDLPEEPVWLEADPHRLAQALSNLLNNAAKYTPSGGRITLAAERRDDELTISVTDTGVGIPTEEAERIFEMFAQIQRPNDRGFSGLGIGLTLVKSLVEMHGGRVSVRSDGAGQGSVFCMALPLPEQQQEAVSPEAAPAVPAGGEGRRRRVLVVDDNQAAAAVLVTLVKMLGHECRSVSDGLQAVEAAEAWRPELVLMDIGMPVMDGYEAATRIRRAPWGQGIRLVALTGWGQAEDKARAKEAGFDHHLVKPAGPEELQAVLSGLDG